MKFTIDTTNKLITIEDRVNFKELYDFLEKILGGRT